PELRLAHFRDPWSGIALIDRGLTTVYEVNGLPSIELPFLYPLIPPAILDKVQELEQRCLEQADVIITPSPVTKRRLPDRAVVIPNGADLRAPSPRPPDAPDHYLLYFGALQPWQGVDTALRALARLPEHLTLVICASTHPRRAKPYRKLAEHLGIEHRLQWHFALPEDELAPYREHALLSLAPLNDSPRNPLHPS